MNEYSNSKNIFTYLGIAALSFVFGWQATAHGLLGVIDAGGSNIERTIPVEVENYVEVDMALFWTIWDQLDENFVDVDSLNSETMVYGAIKGLVDSLDDPYTVFMTPEESEQFSASLEGTLEGIGAELTVEEHNLVIVSPIRNSPAEKAGLLPGDMIYQIDGKSASEMTLFDAIMSIRGEKGTTVTLTIIRQNLDDSFEVSIVRDSIDIESVTVEKLDNGIVYLSVNQFNDKTNEEFRHTVSEMLLDEPSGIIIDLRFNGGGYLDIAVELLSFLLPSDTVSVLIRERDKEDGIMYTNGNPKILNVPLVVLINEGSASASEIVAGAIQDHKRGVIMGTTSFGKGSVQEVDTFSDGSSIRMTIAKWLTPDERDIHEVGITPDIVVEITDEDVENKYDSQREAAIEYLENL